MQCNSYVVAINDKAPLPATGGAASGICAENLEGDFAMNVHDTSTKAGQLTLKGKEAQLPVRSGTVGPDVMDIGRLYRETGCFTYDPGFTSTANCVSRITYIDGDEGTLLYRGYPIDELV